MRILHVTPTFYPAIAYGGPIYSTYALCNALARIPGVELKVLTTDAAGPRHVQRVDIAGFPVKYPGGYDVYFTRRILRNDVAPGMLMRLGPMVAWADVVQITGTYSVPTIPALAVARLLGRPVLWSPRGALLASHTWEKATRPAMKRAWEQVCAIAMPCRTVLHVTSDQEAEASRERIHGARVAIVGNGIDLPEPFAQKAWRAGGRLRLMFIGRLDPVKALDRLIEALALVAGVPVELDIYGAGEPAYVNGLRQLAAERGVAGRVYFRGPVEGEAKRQAFATADVGVLVSHSENFGMAAAEAMAHAIPVIVGSGVPWRGVEQRGCGRSVENTPEKLAEVIREITRADLQAMGAAGRRWMSDEFGWDGIAARMRDLMLDMTQSRGQPT